MNNELKARIEKFKKNNPRQIKIESSDPDFNGVYDNDSLVWELIDELEGENKEVYIHDGIFEASKVDDSVYMTATAAARRDRLRRERYVLRNMIDKYKCLHEMATRDIERLNGIFDELEGN